MRETVKTITLRLDADEYQHLRELSESSGLKYEPLLRKIILGTTINPKPPDLYAALLKELSAIGNNANQIAHVANSKKDITADEVHEAARLIWQAWRVVKDAF